MIINLEIVATLIMKIVPLSIVDTVKIHLELELLEIGSKA